MIPLFKASSTDWNASSAANPETVTLLISDQVFMSGITGHQELRTCTLYLLF